MANRKRVVIEINRGLMSLPRIDERIDNAFQHSAIVATVLADASEDAVDDALRNWNLDGGTPDSEYGGIDSIDGGTL